jgi:hypothetical protein
MKRTHEKGKIVHRGMGGLLCPPSHPMLTMSVETDLRRKPENRGSMALDYAAKCEYLDGATRAAARTVLAAWRRPPLDSPEIQEWILQVLGYFKTCYNFSGHEIGWHAANLTIDAGKEPMEHADCHAGVHCIREYYPEFQPTPEHFQRAYWGKKPA